MWRDESPGRGPKVTATPQGARWRPALALVVILAGAAALRFYGAQWDGGYLFHPDERQIMLVADGVSFPWPPQRGVLLSPSSPWNPHFFSYGSLPIYLLRLCADLAGLINPVYRSLAASYLVGRALSALFDLGTVLLIYALGKRLYGASTGLLASALVALSVLHIQLAHFYVTDAPLTFFATLTVLLAVRAGQRFRLSNCLPLGLAWGCALATKVSVAPLAAPVALAWAIAATRNRKAAEAQREAAPPTGGGPLAGLALTGLVAVVTFALLEPYALIDYRTFLSDVGYESLMASGRIDAPYTRQYIGTVPYLYLAWQTIVWGMGIPLGLAAVGGTIAALASAVRQLHRRQAVEVGGALIALSWVVTYFGLIGSLHAKFLRYMLPIMPLLCLFAAWGLIAWLQRRGRPRGRWAARGALTVTLVGTLLYALAYTNVYRQDHPWIQATAWLCQNLPRRSPITVEHWDDPLPLYQGTGSLSCYGDHYFTRFEAYEEDDQQKLDHLLSAVRVSDYIVLSTNRLYNTIPRLPERYPLTSRYYELLLGEQLGFELVYYGAVYPSLFGVELVDDTFSDPPLPIPRLIRESAQGRRQLVLGRADESFTVYDHPKPLIFRRVEVLSRDELLRRLGDAAVGLPAGAPVD
jgi:hypothetical protein